MARSGVTPLVPRLPNSGARPTGETLTRLWALLFEHAGPSWQPSTLRNYSRTRDLSKGLPDFPAPGDIVVWLTGLANAGMEPTTVGTHRDGLHRVYEFGRDSGWTSINPVAIAPFRRQKPKRKALERIETVWPFLLAAADDERERALLGVFRFLGVRRGEALGLRRDDFNTAGEVWHVRVERQRHPSKLEGRQLKTDASARTLPVRAPLRALLEPLFEAGDAVVRTGLGGGVLQRVEWLFPYRQSQLDGLLRRLRGVVADAFPPDDAWHVWRHTVAVELSRAGRTVEQISEWLGHASIAKTATYLRSLCGHRIVDSLIDGLDPPSTVQRKTAPGASTRAARRSSNTRDSSSPVAVQPRRTN